jgi:flagellar basal-body rod modification protein FlgD
MSSVGASSQVSQTDFLTLLTTQLRYQDPTSPVDQDAFISQLSQFSMLESINKLNSGFEQMLKLQEISQGVDLVGKNVTYQDTVSGEIETGMVDEVAIAQGSLIASINGNPVPIEMISSITA